MEGWIKAMLAMEEWGQKLRKIASYSFFKSRCKDIQFSSLQFLNVKIAVSNTENVTT